MLPKIQLFSYKRAQHKYLQTGECLIGLYEVALIIKLNIIDIITGITM